MATYNFLDKTGLGLVWAKIKALIPSKTSDLQNDSGFITDVQDSDGNTLVSNGVAELPEYLDAPTVYVYEWDINNDSNTVYFYKDHYCEEHYTFRELNADIMKKPSLLIGFFDGEDRRYHLYAQSYASWLWSLKQLDGYSSFSNSIWTNVINKSGDHWDDNAYAVYNETGNAIDYDDLVNKPTIPTVEQSDWEEDDSTDDAYILNRPAIRAGDGENSIVEGQIEDETNVKTYTLLISGPAKATTFSYTTEDELPSASNIIGKIAYIEAAVQNFNKWQRIVEIDTSNNTITLMNQVSETAAISNEELIIYHLSYSNIAYGALAHATGKNTVAAGNYSRSEGSGNLASGAGSHAEGSKTTSSGTYSHSEGTYTIASGSAAHAEGINTIANHKSQHVIGEYNIEDPSTASNLLRGNYVQIVGNGTSSARSNAYTLDWSGNGVYAGKLTVGTGPTNNMDVATKQYVDNAIPTVPDEVMTVTISQDGSDYISDKTFSEMSSHLSSGGLVICKYNGGIFVLKSVAQNWLIFSLTESTGYEVISKDFTIDTTDYVSYSESVVEPPIASNFTPLADGTASAGSYGAYSRADHVHPQSGVTSFNGSTGAITYTAPVTSVTLNGSTTVTPSFYAPTNAGTSGYVLTSNGSGAPTWQQALAGVTVTLNGSTTTTPSFFAPTTTAESGWILTSGGTGAPHWLPKESELYVVTFEFDDGEITVDKQFGQIYGALNQGKYVYGETSPYGWNYYVYEYNSNEGWITFKSSGRYDYSGDLYVNYLTIDSNNNITSDFYTFPIPNASTVAPLVDGTANAGTAATYARADHVHPKITYSLSMSTAGVITLSGSDSNASTIALPIYDGSVSTVGGGS